MYLEEKDSVNVFVFSDIKDRISYAVSHYGVDEKQAKLMIEKCVELIVNAVK